MIRTLCSVLGRPDEPRQAHVEIYTWRTCPSCIRATLLLRCKGVRFTQYRIGGDPEARSRMARRAHGRWTVPEVFINGRHVGGCDELYALARSGELDQLFTQAPR